MNSGSDLCPSRTIDYGPGMIVELPCDCTAEIKNQFNRSRWVEVESGIRNPKSEVQ